MLSHKRVISEYVSCVIDSKMSEKNVPVHALLFYHRVQLHVFLGPSICLRASGIILDQADPTTINEVARGEVGEIVHRTPSCHARVFK